MVVRGDSQQWVSDHAGSQSLERIARPTNERQSVKFTRSIQTSDLQLFGSLEEAQRHELKLVFGNPADDTAAFGFNEIADTLIKEKDRVLDILTTTEKSRPSARRINGAVRKKRDKVVAVPATEGAK